MAANSVRKGQYNVAQVILNKTKSLYPVLDERGCSPYWNPDLDFAVLYDADAVRSPRDDDIQHAMQRKDSLAQACIPVTISRASLSNFELQCVCYIAEPAHTAVFDNKQVITLYAAEGPIATGRIESQSTYDHWVDHSTSVRYLSASFVFNQFTFFRDGERQRNADEPWSLCGKIAWKVSAAVELSFAAYIELFAINPAILPWMRTEGIPANLLRFALAPPNGRSGFYEKDYVPYKPDVTTRVFKSGFAYDRYSGSAQYTRGAGDDFQLDKWLQVWAVMNGLASPHTSALYRKRYSQGKATVNCMDQAAILGLCLTFCCKDDAELSCIKPVFTKPFGFIYDTTLVGHDQVCNSPYVYRTGKNKYDEGYHRTATEDLRTFFTNHVYIVWDRRGKDDIEADVKNDEERGSAFHQWVHFTPHEDKDENEMRTEIETVKGGDNLVFDACAGPICGDRNLRQYLQGGAGDKGVIDHATPQMYVEDEKENLKSNDGDKEGHTWAIVSRLSDGKKFLKADLYEYTARLRDVGYTNYGHQGVGARWGFMGEIEAMLKSTRTSTVLPEEVEYKLDEKTLAEHLKKSTFPNATIDGPHGTTQDPEADERSGCKGTKESALHLTLDGNEYVVHIDWRTYRTALDSDARYNHVVSRGISGMIPSQTKHGATNKDKDKFEVTIFETSDPKIENSCLALMGRCVVQISSVLAADKLLAFTQGVIATVSEKDDTGLYVAGANWASDGEPNKKKEIEAGGFVRIGETFEVAFWADWVSEVDWEYGDDSVFLLDHWHECVNGRSQRRFRFVGRKIISNPKGFVISFHDWHFSCYKAKLQFKVVDWFNEKAVERPWPFE